MSKEKPRKKGKWWIIIVVLILIFAIGSCGDDTETKPHASSETVNKEPTSEVIENESMPEPTPEQTNKTVETVKTDELERDTEPIAEVTPESVESKEDSLTLGQKNALKSAESYLSFSAFSYEGLIKQLEYEGYTNEEAVFATDNCGADWKEQALKSAKNYLDFSAFSYTGLIGQLEYEGYTNEEAVYGVDNCGADWNEQAVKSAESYLEYSSFSKNELIGQLEYEGYTTEQAGYAAAQVGY